MKTGLTLRYKKGNTALETLTTVVFIVVFTIVTIMAYSAFSDVNTDLQASNDLSSTSKETLTTIDTTYQSTFDYAIFLMFILLSIGSIVSAYFVDSHPLFFVFTVILLIAVGVVSVMLNNVFFDVIDMTWKTVFPLTFFIIDNILMYIIITGALITIALYMNR